MQFLLANRDATSIIMWMDNCGAQNKNWLLYSSLLQYVQNEDVAAEVVEVKYLEPGHTFMAADSEHAAASKKLDANKLVLDVNDFSNCVKSNNLDTKVMSSTDFFHMQDNVSIHRLNILKDTDERPYLEDVVSARFVRGSLNFEFKMDYIGNYKSYSSLLKNNVHMDQPFSMRTHPRGISSSKKEEILEKLVPLMPAHRRGYWQRMPANNESQNLLTHLE
jgi:hypothetical protein